MRVLSLFDWMSCGMIALERAWIPVSCYYASEIDNHAISVSRANYPQIIQLWDVNNWRTRALWEIDLIIGGSPCQWFSSIWEGLAFDDPRSKLFFTMVDIIGCYKPKYFLLENVKMRKEYVDIISGYMGVAPVEINSSLVSAQNRKRLYRTNIPFSPPDDKVIVLDHVIDHTICTKSPQNREKRVPDHLPLYVDPYNRKEIVDKSTTLRTNVNNGNMRVKQFWWYRNLTRSECEKLQTVPVWYTSCVSENQAKKMLGNWWTVDVIAHVFSNIHQW